MKIVRESEHTKMYSQIKSVFAYRCIVRVETFKVKNYQTRISCKPINVEGSCHNIRAKDSKRL